ncbi:MAG: hypothetical protein J7K15_10210 [Deltaproteobacteria bacterium]|nr:hypothetical protein [Deltaproteobacteria bacterium]
MSGSSPDTRKNGSKPEHDMKLLQYITFALRELEIVNKFFLYRTRRIAQAGLPIVASTYMFRDGPSVYLVCALHCFPSNESLAQVMKELAKLERVDRYRIKKELNLEEFEEYLSEVEEDGG